MIDNIVSQALHEIAARPEGPMAFRFYLQPAMALVFAIRDGFKDARSGRPAYFWSLLTDPAHRRERLLHGWKSVGRIFIISMAMDVIYQLFVLHGFRPLQTVVVAVLLAIVPYVALRGPVTRVVKKLAVSHR